ncbi:MAG TPA: GtrA family protein [Baekduia sp.]|nr:GtrA family protein [Baekduia sp.]
MATAPWRERLDAGVRRASNWLQLIRYALVGISGVVLNLGTFSVLVEVVDVDFRIAGVLAFCVAVVNNFFWHRHWTFEAQHGHAGFQAARFVTVSVTAFVVGIGMLWTLVDVAGLPEVGAQAVSLAVAAPVTFLVNRFWSFRR